MKISKLCNEMPKKIFEDFLINFCKDKYFQPKNAMDKGVNSGLV